MAIRIKGKNGRRDRGVRVIHWCDGASGIVPSLSRAPRSEETQVLPNARSIVAYLCATALKSERQCDRARALAAMFDLILETDGENGVELLRFAQGMARFILDDASKSSGKPHVVGSTDLTEVGTQVFVVQEEPSGKTRNAKKGKVSSV